jgi:hypothetical protein
MSSKCRKGCMLSHHETSALEAECSSVFPFSVIRFLVFCSVESFLVMYMLQHFIDCAAHFQSLWGHC